MPGALWRQTIKRLGKRTSYSKQIGLLEPFYLNAIFLTETCRIGTQCHTNVHKGRGTVAMATSLFCKYKDQIRINQGTVY